jgi:2-keto-4-pentenoate hydratase
MRRDQVAAAARVLSEAYISGWQLARLPHDLNPASEAEAYEIQEAFAQHVGAVGGWKLSVDRPGRPAMYSPIPAERTFSSWAAVDVSRPKVSGLEIEVAVRFAQALPPCPNAYTTEEVAAAIGSLHVAFEVCGSRYVDKEAVLRASLLADLQANAGIVVGDELLSWQVFLWTDVECVIALEGSEGRTAKTVVPCETIIASLTWMANALRHCRRFIEANDVVLTGAPFSPIPVKSGDTAAGYVSGLGHVQAICI